MIRCGNSFTVYLSSSGKGNGNYSRKKSPPALSSAFIIFRVTGLDASESVSQIQTRSAVQI
jgi:hypothetical protein